MVALTDNLDGLFDILYEYEMTWYAKGAKSSLRKVIIECTPITSSFPLVMRVVTYPTLVRKLEPLVLQCTLTQTFDLNTKHDVYTLGNAIEVI